MLGRYLYQIERVVRAPFEAPVAWPERSVLLASFPKSGNSWLRFVLSNVNAQVVGEPPATFHSIERFAPAIRGNRRLVGAIHVENQPLFLKTHFPYTRYFEHRPAVVIVRDPFFVIPSYWHYLKHARGRSVPALDQFAFHWRYGFNAWANFMASWDGRAAFFIKYEEAAHRPQEILGAMYEHLGYQVSPKVLDYALSLSSRKEMKKNLADHGDPNNSNNFKFVREVGENRGFHVGRARLLADHRLSPAFFEQVEKFGYV